MQQQRNKNEGSVSQERYHEHILRKLREERENGIRLVQNIQG